MVSLVIGVVLAMASNSFAINDDLSWAAKWLLPGDQFDSKDEREWTSEKGYIYGHGNLITAKLRFDDEAINTFRHQIGGSYHFGLELDIVECSCDGNSPQLVTASIQHSLPLSTRPVMDTDFGDSITNSGNCKSNGGDPYVVGALMIREPQYLESGVDYYVFYYLEDCIPASGVNLHLTLKLTQYVPVIKALSYDFVYGSIINGIRIYFGNDDVLDIFNYFVVESDSYESFIAKPTGYNGTRWSDKVLSTPCVIEDHDMCVGLEQSQVKRTFLSLIPSFVSIAYASDCVPTSTASKQAMYVGDLGIPVDYDGTSPPGDPIIPTLPGPFPNLHIEELNLHDSAYNKLPDDGTAYLKPGETYEIHVWPESTEEHCLCGTNNEEIEVITDTYVKIGISQEDGNWMRIKRSYTHCKYMDEDDSKKEVFFWTVPFDAAGKLIAFKAKVDSTNIIRESNEDDNGCDIEYYPVEGYCPSCPDFVSKNVKLTCGKTELNLGDKFGLEADILNQGSSDCPIDIHGAYYLKTPNATSWVNIADDTSGASGLSVGEIEHEYTTDSPFTANVIGTWQGMFCADYQNQVREQNEDNNCQTFSFKVNPVGPDFIVSSLGFKEGLSFKRKISSHPWAIIRNIGNQTPKSSIRIAYYIDGVFRDDDTIEASELTPGRDQFESVLNNSINLGDWGTRTLTVKVDIDGKVVELNESNNSSSVKFTVIR